jgi:hypothetical protein
VAGRAPDALTLRGMQAGAPSLPLDALRIGHLDGDLFDTRSTWLRHREIAASGAILVRPDRFVCWRHLTRASEPSAELAAALSDPRPASQSATSMTTTIMLTGTYQEPGRSRGRPADDTSSP